MKKGITLLALILLVISCGKTILNKETDHYIIKVKEANTNKLSFLYHNVNCISFDNVNNIDAKRINLKDLFVIVLNTTDDNVIVDNKERLKEDYQVDVELKKSKSKEIRPENAETVRPEIVNELLTAFHLNLKKEKVKITNINIDIQDTVKFNRFRSTADKNKEQKTIWKRDVVTVNNRLKKDTVVLVNQSLKELAKLLSSNNEHFISNNDSVRINYQWSNNDTISVIKKLENDLGLSFNSTEAESYKYILKDK